MTTILVGDELIEVPDCPNCLREMRPAKSRKFFRCRECGIAIPIAQEDDSA